MPQEGFCLSVNMAGSGWMCYNVYVFCRIEVKEENYNSSVQNNTCFIVQKSHMLGLKTVQVWVSHDLVCTAGVC